tara:strand:- start:1553 stop:2032 length:480 start_codon:yes stop_codon:yes gene_type:complete
MARITVEDCIDKFPSRFELVLVASQRAKKLFSGENPTVEKDNDKNTVIALREIAETSITIDEFKESLIQEFQTVSISDEEDENKDLDAIDNEDLNSDLKETSSVEDSESNSAKQIDDEIKELSTAEDKELEENFEIIEDNQSSENTQSSENDEEKPNLE